MRVYWASNRLYTLNTLNYNHCISPIFISRLFGHTVHFNSQAIPSAQGYGLIMIFLGNISIRYGPGCYIGQLLVKFLCCSKRTEKQLFKGLIENYRRVGKDGRPVLDEEGTTD